MLKYKENTFVTPMSSSYFLLAQFAKTKRKEKKEIVYTEPAEGALSFYTSKSLLKTWTCMSPLHTSWNVSTFSTYFFHIPEEYRQDNKPIIDNNGATVAFKHKISFLTVTLIIFLHSEVFVVGKGCRTVFHCHGV